MTRGDKVVGYVRVSTGGQAANGASLDAQRRTIEEECERRGWHLLAVEQDVASGKTTKKRPGLDRALAAVERGDATALVVAKLDRLSRSMLDFSTLLDRARRKGWAVVVLDLGIDTTTPSGELVANVLLSLAQWERRMIGLRTREGLAVKREQGVRLGRPGQVSPELRERIRTMRDEGMSADKIASTLNIERVPTTRGGARWYASTIRRILAPQ